MHPGGTWCTQGPASQRQPLGPSLGLSQSSTEGELWHTAAPQQVSGLQGRVQPQKAAAEHCSHLRGGGGEGARPWPRATQPEQLTEDFPALAAAPGRAEAAMGCARWLALGGLLALAGLLQARLLLPQQAGFGECDRFFYKGTPPAGLATEAHVRICQRFAGSERFATLYSPGHRIPVFSAFRAARPASRRAEQRGLLEPQVSRPRENRDLRFRSTPQRLPIPKLQRALPG